MPFRAGLTPPCQASLPEAASPPPGRRRNCPCRRAGNRKSWPHSAGIYRYRSAAGPASSFASSLPIRDGCYQGQRIRLGTVRTAVAGVLLAAGQGSRFGRPKALVELDGQTLAERGVTMLRAGGTDPVLIVTGAAQVDLSPEN